jgi:peptidoglycan/LPS O-acetylase OafA/YrhL
MTELLEKKHTFEMLDVIRGLAAIIVAERHLARYFFEKELPGSYLAVDIFFVLSGFVLAHAYELRFAQGLSMGRFLLMRVIRLYPLYLLAFLLGLAMLALGGTLPDWYLTSATLAAALFMPLMVSAPANAPLSTLYPLDHPTWTLVFELLVNGLHALLAPHLTNRVLNGLIVASAALLIAATLQSGHFDVGHGANYLAGIPRVCFSYFLGVRLYRAWRVRERHAVPAAWAVIVGVIAVLLLPVPLEYRAYYDLPAVLLLIPALVYHAASVSLGAIGKKLLLPLGAASYAYYVLHVPFGMFCDAVAQRAGIDLTARAPWSGVGVLVALLAVSLVLDAVYDRPVRRWLTARLARRAT